MRPGFHFQPEIKQLKMEMMDSEPSQDQQRITSLQEYRCQITEIFCVVKHLRAVHNDLVQKKNLRRRMWHKEQGRTNRTA